MVILKKFGLLVIVGFILFSLFSCLDDEVTWKNLGNLPSINGSSGSGEARNGKNTNCQLSSIKFARTNNQGQDNRQGSNYVVIFNPKAKDLDFKVSVALAHNIYAKDAKGGFIREYVPKRFHEIIADENAQLNGRKPIAAINGDYIDIDNKPQGLNISRGVEYSGAFKDKRSSFGISGGRPETRKATIQKGKRNEKSLNYNVVGGNGRFYNNGTFKNICKDLGEYACYDETSRSMAAITSKGYVIWLVNNAYGEQALYPDQFDDVLEGISKNYCLGNLQEGMLFDGGWSTGLYYKNKIYVENSNPIGSVFLIYQTEYLSQRPSD